MNNDRPKMEPGQPTMVSAYIQPNGFASNIEFTQNISIMSPLRFILLGPDGVFRFGVSQVTSGQYYFGGDAIYCVMTKLFKLSYSRGVSKYTNVDI